VLWANSRDITVIWLMTLHHVLMVSTSETRSKSDTGSAEIIPLEISTGVLGDRWGQGGTSSVITCPLVGVRVKMHTETVCSDHICWWDVDLQQNQFIIISGSAESKAERWGWGKWGAGEGKGGNCHGFGDEFVSCHNPFGMKMT